MYRHSKKYCVSNTSCVIWQGHGNMLMLCNSVVLTLPAVGELIPVICTLAVANIAKVRQLEKTESFSNNKLETTI
jgi:hypothetical protein